MKGIATQRAVAAAAGLVAVVVVGAWYFGVYDTAQGKCDRGDLGACLVIANRSTPAPTGSACPTVGALQDRGRGEFLGSTATVQVDAFRGKLSATTSDGNAWGLSSGEPPPTVISDTTQLRVQSVDGCTGDWRLVLPSGPALNLDVAMRAGEARLDLANANLARIDLRVSAWSGSLSLPARQVEGSISIEAGSISLCVPSGAGLSLTAEDNVTAAYNFRDRGLSRVGDAWVRAGSPMISLEVDASAGSVTLDPDGGCQ